jgi:hypothetical protein
MAISKKGVFVDMDALSSSNGHVSAIGNAKMNARGDIVDSTGKVIESREEQNIKHNSAQKNGVSSTVKQAPNRIMPDDIKVLSPQEALAKQRRTDQANKRSEKVIVEDQDVFEKTEVKTGRRIVDKD